LYHDWARTLDVVLRHDHRAGEKIFVDYAGDKIPIHHRQTGDVIYQASLFVAVLGASDYTVRRSNPKPGTGLTVPRPNASRCDSFWGSAGILGPFDSKPR
jgi:transposase